MKKLVMLLLLSLPCFAMVKTPHSDMCVIRKENKLNKEVEVLCIQNVQYIVINGVKIVDPQNRRCKCN